MKIIKAAIEDSEILTTITKKSKAYWGFPDDILKQWEYLLTITKDYIVENEVYKLIENEQIIGYYSYFSVNENTIKLDNMFILPEFIEKGFEKILMNDFLKKVRLLRINTIILEAEPNAEKFYANFGFETIELLESSIKGRYLPIMELHMNKKNADIKN